eukprot:scaffold5194_cov40-Cyclotella_meneghiniana.AAC.2
MRFVLVVRHVSTLVFFLTWDVTDESQSSVDAALTSLLCDSSRITAVATAGMSTLSRILLTFL